MSDTDSDIDIIVDWDDITAKFMSLQRKNGNITFCPPDEIYDKWSRISVDTRKEAAQQMKLFAFWLPILLQRDEYSTTTCWAVQIGLIDLNDDLSLKNIYKIETVEAILRALEKGTLNKDQSKHVIWISNMFNTHSPEAFEDAVHWLERTGEPAIRHRVMELGHAHTCFIALHFIFTEFAKYIQAMGTHLTKMMKALMVVPSPFHTDKSEEMKKKGNEKFQRMQYEDAVKYYSKAITYYPENHIVYGNRALCYIRCKKYLKAAGDGKRAILIKPLWAKGHYRYCDALFFLGEVKMAIEANHSARGLCKGDQEGMKDLEQQHLKFITETAEPKVERPKKTQSKRPGSATRAHVMESQTKSVKTGKSIDPAANTVPQSKVSQTKIEKKPGKTKSTAQADDSTKDSKPSKSYVSSKNGKGEAATTPKKKPKDRNQSGGEARQSQMLDNNKAAVCKELRSLVQDAHTALVDVRSRNAEQGFGQALALLETSTPKELGLSSLDVMLLMYGHAMSLTEIGLPEELGKAQRLLEKIKLYEERTVQCLVFYALGRVYVKENRFAVALEQFSDSLQMVKNQITPGKLTWPLTKEVVKETQPDYFKEILEDAIELCKFPPIPDAICRLDKCHGYLKAEIYFTDPDFKGFIQICCCQRCVVEYHMTCWKTLKTTSFFEKNEKDFLHEPCLTPDCVGQICSVKLFGPTGLVKCKFEDAIPKPQIPKKPRVNQKCTSLRNLKSKEEYRLKKKQRKQAFKERQTISDDILLQKEDSDTQIQQKAWLLYRDRVLLQINQNMELLREEKALHVSALTSILKPWAELDSLKGNQFAVKMLHWEKEQLDTVGQVIELLLERKNRVWARVLVQLLSSCPDIDPKLLKWACQLNSAGLNAAKCFIERYSGHLEQLDLAVLLNFSPLQEAIVEKLGTRPELFSNIGLTVTGYLKQAPPQDMRLFIWTLEEHRDDYVSCHTILDDYFDMMDGHCVVLKKSDENQNSSPMKSGTRKKRLNKVLSLRTDQTSRDEWEQDFFEDDSLSFLHPGDPFSVPSHLREEVAEFEEQYNQTRHSCHYKMFLDNNPDPTKESVYDYFAQIFEQYGPLVADDPLLVGELQYFPQLAQLKIEEAGGFEPFLLQSLRFIKIGRSIGLAKHAVSLQQTEYGSGLGHLDELDTIEIPNAYSAAPDFYAPAVTSFLDTFPYSFGSLPPPLLGQSASGVTVDGPFAHLASGDNPQQAAYVVCNSYTELDLYCSDVDGEVPENVPSFCSTSSVTTTESIVKKDTATQTGVLSQENLRSVAVNTEVHERFESFLGDITKKQKSIKDLENQIHEMSNDCDKVNDGHREGLAVIEENIQKITANIQVTNKELVLFQQKLEEEVKKDQKEKKANQDVLRSLKVDIEELVEEQGSLTRNVREKKANYEAKLSDFLELSNQSAAEKMSLEDELKRCKALLTSSTRRSRTAQLSVVESRRDQGLYGFYRELANVKALQTKLDEAAPRHPNPGLETFRNAWRANVKEVEKKISIAETQYQEQIDKVKSGTRVSALPSVTIDNQPEGAAALLGTATDVLPASSSSHSSSSAGMSASSVQTQHKPPTRTLQPPHSTVFDKAMERLTTMFPDYPRSELTRFVQEMRSSCGGSLSSMTLPDVVGRVTQLILDHQEKRESAKSDSVGRGSSSQCDNPPPVPSVWQTPAPQKATQSIALNVEDPCVICHEDMSPDDISVLKCRHSFHKKCIKSWLKENTTCPTCRDHTLLNEDFPMLGRRR